MTRQEPGTSVMTLSELQAAMEAFVRSRGWYDDHTVKPQTATNLAMSLVLEASEVLEHFQWGEAEDAEAVAAELADVVLYVAQLANVLGLDLTEAVEAKLRVNQVRWAPVGTEAPARLGS